MSEAIFKILIPALAGLISGAIGSLIAPWVNWGVEKRRERLNYRRRTIKECREHLNNIDFNKKLFRETVAYSTIRPHPHLSKKLIGEIETDRITIQMGGRGGGVNKIKSYILDEVARIEKDWGLI